MDTASIESMCKTITKEAQEQVEKIIAQAQKQATQKIRLAEQETTIRTKKIIRLAEQEASSSIRKIHASLEVEQHKMTMLKREELITKIIDQIYLSLQKFAQSKQYLPYFKNILIDTIQSLNSDSVYIIIGKNDPRSEIPKILKDIKPLSYKLDTQTHNMNGVIVYNSNKTIRIINTLQEQVKDQMDTIRLLAYEQLFVKGA